MCRHNHLWVTLLSPLGRTTVCISPLFFWGATNPRSSLVLDEFPLPSAIQNRLLPVPSPWEWVLMWFPAWQHISSRAGWPILTCPWGCWPTLSLAVSLSLPLPLNLFISPCLSLYIYISLFSPSVHTCREVRFWPNFEQLMVRFWPKLMVRFWPKIILAHFVVVSDHFWRTNWYGVRLWATV